MVGASHQDPAFLSSVVEAAAWRLAQALAVRSVVLRFWERCGDSPMSQRVTTCGGDPNAVPGEPGWME